MPASYTEARDQMFALVTAAWNAETAAVAGYVPELRYFGTPNPTPPDATKHWAQVATRNAVREHSAFVGNTPGPTLRQHTTFGVLTFAINSPLSDMQAYAVGLELCGVVQTALTNAQTAGGVFFRNVTVKELAADSKSYRFTVTAEYQFDSVNS